MELAPILISVYNREKHLKNCINALLANSLAKESVLYVVSDAAANPSHEDAINAIRDYIKTINGFKEVNLIARPTNMGSYASVSNAFDFVIKKHGKIIFLEDDIYVTPNFLNFLNDGLKAYNDNYKVFSVSAYSFPCILPTMTSSSVYFFNGHSPWGFATWANRWNNIDFLLNDFNEQIKNRGLFKKLKNTAPNATLILLLDRARIINAMDARIYFNLIKNDQYVVFPTISLTRNTGHDGSGEHCGTNNTYMNQKIDDGSFTYSFPPNIYKNEQIYNVLKVYFKVTFRGNIDIFLLKHRFYSLYKFYRKCLKMLKNA